MTRYIRPRIFVSSITVLLAAHHCAFAWGVYGHQVIGALAEKFLLPETTSAVSGLLAENESLASVANWADAIKSEYKISAKWHYVNIPKGKNDYVPDRDCPKGGCLVSMIGNFAETLADKDADPNVRREALMFLVHFVGDLHQPLHVGFRDDLGGNNVPVYFFGQKTNLHKVWDVDLLAVDAMDFNDYVEKLAKQARPQKIETWEAGTVLDWAFESRGLLSRVYDYEGNRLGRAYFLKNLPVADEQILKAAVRLAVLLNACLASDEEMIR